tara:strand:- start:283 stop:1104 length:822 start_codon:yes stop_codon:yes gene_type:complete
MSQHLTTTPAVRGHLASLMDGNAKTADKACRIHGDYVATLMPSGKWSECPQCLDEDLRAQSQAAIREQRSTSVEQRRAKMHEGAMIPKRFRNRTLESYETEGSRDKARVKAICQAYVERFDDRLAQGGGLVFVGGVGTGKSHLAYAIGNALLDREHTVLGIDVYELIDLVKEKVYREGGMSERQAVRTLVDGLDLLILDEVGAQLGTDWEMVMLFKVINERYKEELPTILISNLDKPELEGYLGPRVMSRTEEGGGTTLVLDWEDYRSRGKGA